MSETPGRHESEHENQLGKPSPEARRALAEAEARRAGIDARQNAMPKELNGRGGLEPTRYDDWEVKGIACDF